MIMIYLNEIFLAKRSTLKSYQTLFCFWRENSSQEDNNKKYNGVASYQLNYFSL